MQKIKGKYTTATVYTQVLEEGAAKQLRNMVSHPAFSRPVAVMPDVHAGKGSVIGFTMPMSERLIPNVVGVDIGCGMLGIKVKKPNAFKADIVDRKIRNRIPFGTDVRDRKDSGIDKNSPFFKGSAPLYSRLWQQLSTSLSVPVPKPPHIDMNWYRDCCDRVGMDFDRTQRSIGSLGGGNHFIEFGSSDRDKGSIWIIVHSGSRQFGKQVCEFHQHRAVKLQRQATRGDYQTGIDKIKRESHPDGLNQKIAEYRAAFGIATGVNNKGLESLQGTQMVQYLYDMIFAQRYASLNRITILRDILDILNIKVMKVESLLVSETEPGDHLIESVHNFISPRDLIIRKGAVESYKEQAIIIPFNMKEGSWICKGKGNEAWNYSAPHGAGRRMSRSQAKRTLNIEDAEKQMAEIYSSCIPIDEVPAAYKPAKEIQRQLADTAEVIERVKPIINLKSK